MKNSLSYLIAAAGVALVVLTVSLTPAGPALAQATKVKPVEVVNSPANPVPTAPQGTTRVEGAVSAQQSGAWSVGLAGTPSVNVANTSMDPVPVKDLSDCEPFQLQLFIDLPDSDPGVTESFTVPSDRLLVIEQVTLEGASTATGIRAFVRTKAGPSFSVAHFLRVEPQGPSGFGSTLYVASQHVRLYADPGTTVDFGIGKNTTSGGGAHFDASVSGYLVDCPRRR